MARTVKTLEQAVRVHQSGDLQHAEMLYRRILRVDPFHPDALHLWGVLAHQQGDQLTAVERIRQAVALSPKNPIYHGNLGAAYRALGRLDDAAESCQQAVQLDPSYAAAHYHLGLVLLGQGNALGAHRRFEQAVRLKPVFPEAWNSLGNASGQLGRHEDAAAAYSETLRLQPQNIDARYNLGNSFLALGRWPEAVEAYSEALRLRPEFPDALNNLGTTLRSLGNMPEAIACYQLAIRQRPGFSEAASNLGAAYASQCQWAEAERWYNEAILIDPQNSAAYSNLGTAACSQGRLDEAVRCYRKAWEINPQSAEPAGNLGNALQLQGRVEEAELAYSAALRLAPRHNRLRVQQGLMLPPIYDSLEDLQAWRRRFTANLEQLHAEGITLDPHRDLWPVQFYLAYQGQNDRDLMASLARLSAREPEAMPRRARAGQKIRVGFLSRYFSNHTIGFLTLGLVEQLPRNEFEVVVISLGSHKDELSERFRKAADCFVVWGDQVAPGIATVAGLNLDVLFFPDVGMDPLAYALAHSRMAPVQCVTWGHPVTTGLSTIDAFLSSELLETSTADAHYTEQLIRFQSLPAYYERPRLPPSLKSREAFGLSAEHNVYLCPQSLFKFHPEFDPLLRSILEQDDRGRIVLIEAPQDYWTERLVARLRRTLGAVFDRVTILPRQGLSDFLNLMAVSDVMLDPLHFGGGNTTYQGLACGVPIVSLPAEFLRGRVTSACYQKTGLDDLVACSRDDYIELAVHLGTDREWNTHVRQRIAASNGVLFNDRKAVEEFAQYLREASI